MNSIIGTLFVVFVLSLISFIAYSSQIFIIWPWYGSELSVELVVLLVPFNVLVGMLLWNYKLAVATNPGSVPDSWRPDTHGEGYEVKKLTGAPRFCRMCSKYKPPRAHHCRTCKQCVLRMDHHCPWVNNCVGHHNYAHFVRFLFYVDLACAYHILMLSRRVLYAMKADFWQEPSSLEVIFIILNFVACVPVLIAVGGFSIYHFWSLAGNSTTIEGWEKDKAATLVRRGKIQEVKFPYNLGSRKANIQSILGESPLWWCWPAPTPGTGLRYQVAGGNFNDDEDSGQAWPPVDPMTASQSQFTLPDSPWTYENGTLNPNLQPSTTKRRKSPGDDEDLVQLPPYHPDYNNNQRQSRYSSDSEDSDADEHTRLRPLVRRGSEGYEVKPVDREQMLRRYLQEEDRYVRYVPEQSSEESGSEDDVPLGQLRDGGK